MAETTREVLKAPSLEQAIHAVHQLPNMPDTVRQVLDYLNDEHADRNHMEQAVARDPVLVARLLQMANSPFYGLTNQVQTIHEAVIVLGLSNLRMIVVTSMLTSLKLPSLADKELVQILFRHSIAVAICAHVLGRKNKIDPDQAFLAGILHDVGKLALMTTFPDIYAKVLAVHSNKDSLVVDAERQYFGFDHAAIGAALCNHWHLPPHICSAIATHHSFADFAETEASRTESLAEILHVANAMAHTLDLESGGQLPVPKVLKSTGKQERLTKDFAEISKLYQQFVVLAG